MLESISQGKKGAAIKRTKPQDAELKKTDIILVDIINFSQLNSKQQLEIIEFLTKSYTKMVETMLANSQMKLNNLMLGSISTGDGFYCILNPRLKGFGVILGLSFNHFSEYIGKKYPYFRGIRVAVHTGEVYQFTDILGNSNYVGDGLNECARYIELKDYTISTVVVSEGAYESFQKFLELYPDYYALLVEHQFKRSSQYSFYDKHGTLLHGYMVWLRRGGIINPPNINFNSLMGKG
ncbi:MAG: hypothetical protein R3302_09475 [Sulfurimonadaceae bacterium]|nr:hypothetical protein [Sulfurimonadaceae bacterium]